MPLSDIVSCPKDQLEHIVSQEIPYQNGQWFLAKNIGMIELSQLGVLLECGSYDDLSAGFKLVGEPLPEGPWPQTIPPALVTALRSITDAQIENICPQWTRSEQFGGFDDTEGLALYLRNLKEFLNVNAGPFFLVNAL